MNHAVVTEHLADYLEGDLALDLRALVDAHLDSCELCASEVREMQQTIRLLRALPEPAHPPMIAANVMRRIRAGETTPTLFERIQRSLGAVLEPSFVLPASAIAVAALVIVVVQGGGSLTPALLAGGEQTSPAALPSGVVPTPTPDQASRATASAPVDPAEGMAGDALERGFGASTAGEDWAAAAEGSAGAPTPAEGLERPSSARLAPPPSEVAESVVMEEGSAEGSPWGGALAAREEGGRAYFVDPVAQGFASDVSGPGAAAPTNRIAQGMGGAVPLSLSRPARVQEPALGGVSDSGGEDPRDVWLARALEHPAEFARYIAQHNLAEQELWVERLSERAEARGLLGELVEALRAAGDEKASWLADDFAAQAKTAAAQEGSAGMPAAESSGNAGATR